MNKSRIEHVIWRAQTILFCALVFCPKSIYTVTGMGIGFHTPMSDAGRRRP